MLAELFLFDQDAVGLGSQSVSLGLLGGNGLDIAPAPGLPDRGVFGYVARGRNLDALSVLGSVLFHHLLVLSLVNLLGTLVVCLGHLLAHDLRESVIGPLGVEPLLLGLLFLLCGFLLASLGL